MSTYFNISNKIVAREAPTGYTVAFAGPFINVPLATFTISNGQKYAQYYYSLVDSASTTITGNGNLGNSITATINVETTDFVDGVITLTVYLINPALENTSDTAVRRVATAQYVVALEARTDSFENEACAYSGLTSLEGIEEPASLVMIPSGYSDGTLGSLKPIDGSGDFTFTRGIDIGVTRVAEDGYIEKGYENLLLQSNSFTTSPWSSGLSGGSIVTGETGHDGSSNAWLMTTQGTNGYLSQSISQSGVQTLSLYAKAGSAEYLLLRAYEDSTTFAYYHLSGSGSVTLASGDVETNITRVGTSDWYRCSLTYTGGLTLARVYMAGNNTSTVNVGDNIYIQDAQINQGLVAMPYLPTTTTTSVGGILANQPRIDFTGGGCGSLLLEPSRTNELLYSEYFDGWQLLVAPTVTTNYGISPEGVQNSTRFQTSVGRLTQDIITINNNETFSVYMKGSGTMRIEIGSDNFFPSVTSEWVRYEFKTTQIGGNSSVQIRGNGSPVDVELYGAQYERNSYATSLIPTYGTSVTRAGEAAKTFIDTNDNWSLYFEYDTTLLSTGDLYVRNGFLGFIGGFNENIWWRYNNVSYIISNSGVNTIKLLFRRTNGNIDTFYNGVEEFSGISSLATGTQPITLEGGKHRKMLLFPTALSDAECIELTTI